MGGKPNDADERVLNYVRFYGQRLHGVSDDQIARSLGFGSPTALYQRLSQGGFPICPTCGATPVEAGHCEERQRRRKRKARRGGGEAVQLPPASSAEGLFHQALKKLESELSRLPTRKEVYRDERFETVSDYPAASATYTRKAFPPGEVGDEIWKEICKEHGQDPSIESFYVSDAPIVTSEGARRTPPDPLTALIKVYELSGEPLDPLLEVLHPDPSAINKERLKQAVEESRHKDGQLATLVRGGIIRRGPSTEELSSQELVAAWHITKRRQEGASDEKIYQELHPHGYTKEDVSRLGNLRRRPPE